MENESQKEEQHITENKNSLKPNSEKSEKELLASIAETSARTSANMAFFFYLTWISVGLTVLLYVASA